MIYKNGHMRLRKIVTFDNPLEERTNAVMLRVDDDSLIIAKGIKIDTDTKTCYWTQGNYHQSDVQIRKFVNEQVDDMAFSLKSDIKSEIDKIMGWKK